MDPLVGSWLVQVAFSPTNPQVPTALRGTTESVLITFVPGGGLVASGPYATSAAGQWQAEEDGSYAWTLVELVFDASTHAVARAVVVEAAFTLDSTNDRLSVHRGRTTVYPYDPSTGRRQRSFQIDVDSGDEDPAETTAGERLVSGRAPPVSFPR